MGPVDGTQVMSRWWAAGLLVMVAAWCGALSVRVGGQETIRITGDRLSGVVLPVEPLAGDMRFAAFSAQAWEVDDTKRLHLAGDVRVTIAGHQFEAGEAVVWLNRMDSAGGLINQVAIYFDRVVDPGKRAGLGVTGDRLLVTGSARGAVTLQAASMRERRSAAPIVRAGEARLADHIRRLVSTTPALAQRPQTEAPARATMPPLVPGGVPPETLPDLRDEIELPVDPQLPLFDPSGRISVSAGQVEVESGEVENVILATGLVMVEYSDDKDDAEYSRLTLSAERAVIFTKPGPLRDLPNLAAEADFVRGIYLEGNVVATDGNYTVRGDQIYYDVAGQRAIVMDGVVKMYSANLRTTIYARAREMHQLSRDQWRAKKTVVSTSEFFTPHLALGSGDAVVTRRRSQDADTGEPLTETHVDSRGNTMRIGGVPILWWPRLSGTLRDVPLRSASIGTSNNNGVEIKTAWGLYSLLGREPVEGTDIELELDAFTKRGVGAGVKFEYDFTDTAGVIDLYGMIDDGIDKTSAGREVDQDSSPRGVALWEHQMRLSTTLVMQAQASFISDETFITTFREDDFHERREYETSFYLRNLDDHTAWTVLAKYDLDDFISNSWLLASRAAQVEKLPELTYRRYGDSIFGERFTYSSEYRYSRVGFSFERNTPEELGVRSSAFGIPFRFAGTTSPSDLFEAAGYPTRFLHRFDTRHELSMPGKVGIFDVTPFVAGRFTMYDDEFENFSEDSDSMRFFGAAGLRISTLFQRIDNSVESRLFDLHRLRHLVEPSILLWYGYSSVRQTDLPVFDEAVESLANATAVRFGLLNTWQTQRGGPGNWRSVDVLTFDVALVLASNDADREHPVPQFFEYRPEYSNMVDHWSATLAWQVSDTLSIVSEGVYDIDEGRFARGAVGMELRHSPVFTTFVEFRYLDADDLRLLGVGWTYQITPKYTVAFSPQWDFNRDEFRALRLALIRRFPDFDLNLSVRHDQIVDETKFSATVQWTRF